MPLSKRGKIKRKHDQTIIHFVRSKLYMSELYEQFLDHHPDYAEVYQDVCKELDNLIIIVNGMKERI